MICEYYRTKLIQLSSIGLDHDLVKRIFLFVQSLKYFFGCYISDKAIIMLR